MSRMTGCEARPAHGNYRLSYSWAKIQLEKLEVEELEVASLYGLGDLRLHIRAGYVTLWNFCQAGVWHLHTCFKGLI